MKKKLPIGIQNLREIIEEGYYYVDKTKYVCELANRGKFYFLSRPRRFGKSLFVDTLKEAFLGNRELFKGLYLENNWDWSKRYPVIHISFGSGDFTSPNGLINRIEYILGSNEKNYNITINQKYYSERFSELIKLLNEKYNEKVVILVDEYDKPILDKIEEKEVAEKNREVLRNFYSVIKDSDSYLKFVFITGVTKFNKVSIFSGLNQLEDITLDKNYSTICGYTESDLMVVFKEELEGLEINKIRHWYNGYNWRGESVYNPYDVLLLFSKRLFQPHWFSTGTPDFLMKLIKDRRYFLPDIEKIRIDDSILDTFDIDNIGIENLLFQTGYLTIDRIEQIGDINFYKLRYPNFEVRYSLNSHLLRYLTGNENRTGIKIRMEKIFIENKLEEIEEVLRSLYASIPYEWYVNNRINEYEGYYASVFYALMAGLGMKVNVEESTNKGRIDLVLENDKRIYVVEFKVIKVESEKGKAIKQILEKKYYEKYLSGEKEVYLIGVEFDENEKNVTNVEYEKIK